jgi:hypothetical protein
LSREQGALRRECKLQIYGITELLILVEMADKNPFVIPQIRLRLLRF